MRALGLALVMVLSGCLATAPHQPPANVLPPAAEVASSPPVIPQSSVLLQGTIVFRAPGTGPLAAEGDEASFCFTIPPGTTRIQGNLSWFPGEEQMGLEFQYKGRKETSWDDGQTVKPSPIVVSVDKPEIGEWFAYAGPGVVGGGVAWQLNLTVTGSQGSASWDGLIEPEGSRFDPNNDGCVDWG